MDESAESTEAGQKDENQTQSQSTQQNDPLQTIIKQTDGELILVLTIVCIAGIIGFLFLNKKLAKDSAQEFWDAEQEFHGKRLFGDAWKKDEGYN